MTARFHTGLLAAIVCFALVVFTPAQAGATVADPLATTVSGACSGGPGRLSLTVHPPAAGRYRVEVTAQGLTEGSRWTGQVGQEGDSGSSRDKGFRRVAVDGGWTVETQFPAAGDAEQGEVLFAVSAGERRDRGHNCFVLNKPTSPVVGFAECHQRRVIALLTRELDDGSTLIRSYVAFARPNSRWHLKLTAVGTGSRQVVEFDDRAGSGSGAVLSRVVITGVKDPRLRLMATNESGRRCFIAVNPPHGTTDAPLTLKGLGGLRALRG